MTTIASSAAAKTYADYQLVLGDSDKAKRWGGSVKAQAGGTPVRDLQNALKAVGVLDDTPDGVFGRNTQQAVRLFQWNVSKLTYRLVNTALQLKLPNALVQVSGVGTADSATAKELQKWVSDRAVTTGNLVRADVGDYSQIENGFKRIANPSVGDNDLVVDADFLGSLEILNDQAKAAKITLYVTQGFRVDGAAVSGAVVTPAKRSQHLIGHAIDCDFRDGATFITSDTFKNGDEADSVDDFITAVKQKGLRWGGDFTPRDYVHFDDYVPPESDEYRMRFFFNQRTISQRQPIRAP
jgi:D-alanyl-D-alanine carboxypeptidase/Putative peptidoglycan binding domain